MEGKGETYGMKSTNWHEGGTDTVVLEIIFRRSVLFVMVLKGIFLK